MLVAAMLGKKLNRHEEQNQKKKKGERYDIFLKTIEFTVQCSYQGLLSVHPHEAWTQSPVGVEPFLVAAV